MSSYVQVVVNGKLRSVPSAERVNTRAELIRMAGGRACLAAQRQRVRELAMERRALADALRHGLGA